LIFTFLFGKLHHQLNLKTMIIEHIAIWANDLEKIKSFYMRYFGAKSNTKYHNPVKEFQSYF
jgi:lactoylglutathione lyase